MKKIGKMLCAAVLSVTMVVSGIVIAPKTEKNTVQAAWNDRLVWSDEFNGTKLDTNIWNYEIGNGQWGWGNGEVEYYTSREDNVRVRDGALQLIAKKEYYGGKMYTSGRITTKGKKAILYGRIEARIKVENGNQDGVWPAFWMMGNNMADGVGWPYCGEIDIMEHANSNNFVGGCLHWNTDGIDGAYSHGSYGSGFDGAQNQFGYFYDNINNGINGWHVYGLLWDENHMEWQLDGVTFHRQNITDNNRYCFTKEQFFLFNLAIGGPSTGYTNNKTANANTYKTTTMYVDYVRAYEYGSKGSIGEELVTPEETTLSSYPAAKKPEYSGAEKETYVVEEDVDMVKEKNKPFTIYDGKAWSGAAISSSQKSVDGAVINVSNPGGSIWGLRAASNDLRVTPGATYRLKTTLKSSVDKKVIVRVRGNDSDSNTFYKGVLNLKAGKNYNLDKTMTIPSDFSGTADIEFIYGLDVGNNETLSSNSFKLEISKTTFTTKEKVTHPKSDLIANTVVQKTSVSKAVKKKSAKKVSITIKKIANVTGYQICFYKTKANANKNKKAVAKITYKKNRKTFTVISKKVKNQKTLFVRVRGYKKVNGKTVNGKWSSVKKVTIK